MSAEEIREKFLRKVDQQFDDPNSELNQSIESEHGEIPKVIIPKFYRNKIHGASKRLENEIKIALYQIDMAQLYQKGQALKREHPEYSGTMLGGFLAAELAETAKNHTLKKMCEDIARQHGVQMERNGKTDSEFVEFFKDSWERPNSVNIVKGMLEELLQEITAEV